MCYSSVFYNISVLIMWLMGVLKDKNLLFSHQQKFTNDPTVPLFLLNVAFSESLLLKAPLEPKIYKLYFFTFFLFNFWPPSKDTPSKILGPPTQPENHLDSCSGGFKEPENTQQLKSRKRWHPAQNMPGLVEPTTRYS